MLREKCKEYILSLENGQMFSKINNLKFILDSNGWYDNSSEDISDLSTALYEFLENSLKYIFTQDLELSEEDFNEIFEN